jgi:hypothetical protein
MKPVLIQYLHRKNKGKYKVLPITEEEKKHYDNKFGSFVLWVVAALVLVGLFLG